MRPDGGQLDGLGRLLAAGQLEISVAMSYERLDAADALAKVVSGRADGAVAHALERNCPGCVDSPRGRKSLAQSTQPLAQGSARRSTGDCEQADD